MTAIFMAVGMLAAAAVVLISVLLIAPRSEVALAAHRLLLVMRTLRALHEIDVLADDAEAAIAEVRRKALR